MAAEEESRAIQLIARRLVPVPPEAQRPRGIAASLAVRRFREGLTTDAELEKELTTLGYTPDEVRRYKLQAALEYETDYTMDLFAGLRDGFRKDQITEAEFTEGLRMLGMVPDRVEGWVFREMVRKFPTKRS